jgi:hypothetical protein
MAASSRLFLLPLLAACSIPPESDYVSDGSVDAAPPDEGGPDAQSDVLSPRCDASYTFNGHCYVFYATRSDWHSAESQCVLTGGHLVAINDVLEQGYVAGTIVNPNVPLDAGPDAPDGVWIGGYLDASADAYAWTTAEPFIYSNFGSSANAGQPSVFLYNAKVVNHWDDFKDTVQAPFICEY